MSRERYAVRREAIRRRRRREAIRRRRKAGEKLRSIAAAFNVSHQRIDQLTRGLYRRPRKPSAAALAETQRLSWVARRIAAFWSRVDRRAPNQCWPWLGALDRDGAGRFRMGAIWETGQGQRPAHWVAFVLSGGELTEEKHVVIHSCAGRWFRRCCNPAHLYAGTWTDRNNEQRRRRS